MSVTIDSLQIEVQSNSTNAASGIDSLAKALKKLSKNSDISNAVTNLNNLLPTFVSSRLQEGFRVFDKRLKGFAVSDAVITGVETRTSAPLRIMRNENLSAISNEFVYPCGEGAGYAGGIMSSAVDGIKVALEIMKKYKI